MNDEYQSEGQTTAVVEATPPGDAAQAAPDQQPTATTAIGGLIAFLVVAVVIGTFGGFLLAGCESAPKQTIVPRVIDSANLLTEPAIRRIEQLRFPTDIPVLVRTVRQIKPEQIGAFATESMEDETAWKTMRRRGFLRSTFRRDSPSSTGIYVLVSQEPALLQIRYGEKVRLTAYSAGIACGEWYTSRQRFRLEDVDRHVFQTLTDVAARLEQASASWFTRKVRSLASLAWSEVEDFLMPSDNFLVETALKNYVRLIAVFGGTGSVWRFLLVSLVCYVLLWLLLKKLVVDRYVLPRVQRKAARFGIQVLSEGSLVAFLATGFLALVVLGRARIEDQMALQYIGLSGLGGLGISPVLFAKTGGFWFAVPVAILVFLKDMLQSNIVEKVPGEANLSFAFIAWAAVFYILPMGICIFAFFMLLVSTISTILDAARPRAAEAV